MTKLKAALLSCASLLLLLFPQLVRAGSEDEGPLELHQLNVVFRHGDRMPETFPKRFPNDPNMHDNFKPMGSGGLTNEGKRRMYRLGEYLRRRYDAFLGNEYADDDSLYGISSDVSRTKMSLQLVLAALYPPSLQVTNGSRWHETLNWQPIPTHYNNFKDDVIFGRDKCEIYVQELAQVLNSSEVQSKLEELEPYFENLRAAVGKSSPITLEDILLLHNNLDVEMRRGMRMEPWMIDALADPRLRNARELYYEINGFNEKLRRLLSGYIIRRINENMAKRSNETSNYSRKVTLYSGHDKNIVSILQALDMYEPHFPEFGSALIFELSRSPSGRYFVEILYHLGIPEEIKTLTIPGCATPCPLSQYLNLTKSAPALDDELYCSIKANKYFEDE